MSEIPPQKNHQQSDAHAHGQGHSQAHSKPHGHSHGNSPRNAPVHSHGHSHAGGSRDNIRFAFFLNAVFSLIELFGGLWFGSFAVIANALHDVGDSMSLGAAWFLEGYANRKVDSNFNFGYRRFSLLSALIAGVVIATGNLLILIECIHKLILLTGSQATPPLDPDSHQGLSMIVIGVIGLAMNSWAAIRLSQGNTQNERLLTWHSVEDILGWAAVLVGGVIVRFTQFVWLDPLLAMALACFVSFNVWAHLKTTVYLFLQGRPADFDESVFTSQVLDLEGVDHMDHLAVWSLDGVHTILSARIHIHSTHDPEQIERIKREARAFAKKQNAEATLETCLMTKSDLKGESC